MKHPWQIAALFLLCLAIAIPGLAWLTYRVVQLDRAEALARRQAELEERVNLALWRMDSFLVPILAQEATRPPSAFEPIRTGPPVGAKGAPTTIVPSPLLGQSSEFVRLHFQVLPADRWMSPQAPQGAAREPAATVVSSATLSENESLLRELSESLSFEQLLRHAPEEMLPSFGAEALAWSEQAREEQFAQAPVVANAYDSGVAQPEQQAVLAPQAAKGAQSPQPDMQQRAGGGDNELAFRNRAFQAYAQQQVIDQRLNPNAASPSPTVREGVSRPVWLGDKLVLVRRVQRGEETAVQGAWLEWEKIQERLRDEVADLLPEFALEPIDEDAAAPASRALATLPVQLSAPLPAAERGWSPILLSLAAAWLCLGAAMLAAGVLLWGVVALSERRAAFVAAVTHELRTPLTTFRIYAEMLAQDMAPPDQRQEYLETLQTEADRLSHLVENVLAYARLERGRRGGRRIEVPLCELLADAAPQLESRAAQAGMELIIDAAPGAQSAVVSTDPQAVRQILFNLVDNASKYAAGAEDRRIEATCRANDRTAQIRIRDYGPGLSRSQRRRLFRPFSKTVQEAAITAPGVGLGLALCRRLARDLGGRLACEPAAGTGASFVLELPIATAMRSKASTPSPR
ncbi:MAG: HAMP domain-containing histidine kinase [Planctomycetes bacterium]|nr:HAMP domain-containing histidine kinase [Planctomycetota bacterium]